MVLWAREGEAQGRKKGRKEAGKQAKREERFKGISSQREGHCATKEAGKVVVPPPRAALHWSLFEPAPRSLSHAEPQSNSGELLACPWIRAESPERCPTGSFSPAEPMPPAKEQEIWSCPGSWLILSFHKPPEGSTLSLSERTCLWAKTKQHRRGCG